MLLHQICLIKTFENLEIQEVIKNPALDVTAITTKKGQLSLTFAVETNGLLYVRRPRFLFDGFWGWFSSFSPLSCSSLLCDCCCCFKKKIKFFLVFFKGHKCVRLFLKDYTTNLLRVSLHFCWLRAITGLHLNCMGNCSYNVPNCFSSSFPENLNETIWRI